MKDQESFNIMLNRKPVSLRRKSFGGQTGVGIYWRKRAIPTSVLPEEGDRLGQQRHEHQRPDAISDPSIDGNIACNNEDKGEAIKTKATVAKAATIPFVDNAGEVSSIGWDDELCRPIYYHRAVTSDDSIMFNDGDNQSDVDIDEDLSGRKNNESATEDYVPDEDNIGIRAGVNSDVNSNDGSTALWETSNNEENSDVPFRTTALTRKRIKTFGNRGKRQRPLSLILTQEDRDMEEEGIATCIDLGSRRISLESSTNVPSTEERDINNRVIQNEDRDSDSQNGDTPILRADVDKASNTSTNKPNKKGRSKKQRIDESSLEKARNYFANLDQTQSLTLDVALPPTVSSRVTRTSHRTNLNSPGINRAYQAYAESIRGCVNSGISPLSIKDYASSRKLHFKTKGEMVDGFLDD